MFVNCVLGFLFNYLFRCQHCEKLIESEYSSRMKDSREIIFCLEHSVYANEQVVVCDACKNPIVGACFKTAEAVAFHPACFVCQRCQTEMQSFARTEGKYYCDICRFELESDKMTDERFLKIRHLGFLAIQNTIKLFLKWNEQIQLINDIHRLLPYGQVVRQLKAVVKIIFC